MGKAKKGQQPQWERRPRPECDCTYHLDKWEVYRKLDKDYWTILCVGHPVATAEQLDVAQRFVEDMLFGRIQIPVVITTLMEAVDAERREAEGQREST